MLNRWHAEDREVVLHQLGTDPERGLAPAESSRRLREHGPNSLRAPRPASRGGLLLRQVGGPLSLVLLAAAGFSFRLGAWVDGAAIVAVLVAGGVLAFLRERRAEGTPAALKRLSAPSARVVRGGKSFLIPAGELVPGDLVEVTESDRVPADLRLFRAQRLFADESSITGESLPVVKDHGRVLPESTALADRSNMLFAGTVVTAGQGTGIVVATGMRTEVGRIARLLGEATPGTAPLHARLADLGQALTLGFLGVAGVALAASRARGEPTAMFLSAAVGLAVASAPEGLPLVVATTLSLGVRRLRRRQVIVRTPEAVDTLGAVTALAAETAGTLTRGEMTARELFLEGDPVRVDGSGYAPVGGMFRGPDPVDPAQWETLEAALRIGALCSNAALIQSEGGTWRVAGDPTEGALLTLAAKGGLWRDDLLREHPVQTVFPFSAERRRMTVVVAGSRGRRTALTKGDPDVVLAHCLHHRTAAGVRPLSPADREHLLARSEEMTGRALRVLGLAYRDDALGEESRSVERSMVWVGLVGLTDPPREGVPEAVAACLAAGISPVIVTGDHKLTALAVAREIGALRPGDEAISGDELDQLTPEAFGACADRYRVYARVTAEHKLGIVRALKHRGHLVATTGAGVTDAPALREADIGIAMGQGGADITREAAAVVVADGSFASVVAAVAEGRGIREHLRRVIACLVSCNVAEVIVLLVGALAALPRPLAPVQVLWVNLVALTLPALALGLGAPDASVMRETPRRPRERVLGAEDAVVLLAGGCAAAASALAVFALAWRGGAGGEYSARTQAFAALTLALLVHAFNCRHRRRSLFSVGGLPGRRFLAAALLSGLLLGAVVQVPPLGGVLGTVPLNRGEWLRAAVFALLPLPAAEAGKAWLRARRDR